MKIMEKNIKDYLHFYIGCEFSNGLDAKVRTVTFSNADTILGAKVGDFKLILRPLSDMTEEEGEEWQKIGFEPDSRGVDYWPMMARNIKFLTDKGFDLFGLIEANLAIKKS